MAAAILSAAQVATGGNSAPALLSFLDAEDVGVYVQNHMDIKEEENKAAFFAEMKMKPDTKHDDTKHDVSTTLEECWAKLSPLVRFGKHDHDCKASDLVYFESLAPWEQRWVKHPLCITGASRVPDVLVAGKVKFVVYHGLSTSKVPKGAILMLTEALTKVRNPPSPLCLFHLYQRGYPTIQVASILVGLGPLDKSISNRIFTPQRKQEGGLRKRAGSKRLCPSR